jgi:hypothetical protein
VRERVLEHPVPHEEEPGDEERQRRAGQEEEGLAVEPCHVRGARGQQLPVAVLPLRGIHRAVDGDGLHAACFVRGLDGRRPAGPHQTLLVQQVVDRRGDRAERRNQEQRARRPAPHEHQRHAPRGVPQQDVEPEEEMGRKAEGRQHGEPPQVEGGKRPPARLRAPEQDREPGAEEQREGAVRLRLHQPPDERAHDVVEPAGLGRPLVEVDDEHPEERSASEDVEGLNPVAVGHGPPRRSDAGDDEVLAHLRLVDHAGTV